ncbi:MAG TPA: hypothetical protein PJ986_14770 [Gammaproteobacteria bacterium]|nr:hypothetical protein [Gammaproteobacteria bacterium]
MDPKETLADLAQVLERFEKLKANAQDTKKKAVWLHDQKVATKKRLYAKGWNGRSPFGKGAAEVMRFSDFESAIEDEDLQRLHIINERLPELRLRAITEGLDVSKIEPVINSYAERFNQLAAGMNPPEEPA